MKKFFLFLFASAIGLTASAEKVVFIADGAQEHYTGDAKRVIVPVGSVAPLTGDFGQISLGEGMFVYSGFYQLVKNNNVTVEPLEGVTVDQIVVRQSVAGTGKTAKQCGLLKTATYNEADQSQILSDISASTAFTVTNQHLRAAWVEVTYSGTPTQVCPVIFDTELPIVAADQSVKLSCATPGASIEYSHESDPFTWYPYTESGVPVKEEGAIYARAKKAGMTDSPESSASYAPIESGLQMAPFCFNLWGTLTPLTNGKSFVESQAKEQSGMKWIYLSAEANAEGTEYKTFSFKQGDVTYTTFIGPRVVTGKYNTRPCLCYDNTYGWTLSLRYYLGNELIFDVPEGYALKAAYVNGSSVSLSMSEECNPTLENCTVEPLFTVNDKTFWYKLTATSDNAEPVKTMKFISRGNNGAAATSQISRMYVFYEKTGSTGVTGIDADNNEPVEYYNLQGVRVNNPSNGLYICRQGSKVKKIFKK